MLDRLAAIGLVAVLAAAQGRPNVETFFAEAPRLNPLRTLITGVLCGVRVEEVEDPAMREIRYLDNATPDRDLHRQAHRIIRAARRGTGREIEWRP